MYNVLRRRTTQHEAEYPQPVKCRRKQTNRKYHSYVTKTHANSGRLQRDAVQTTIRTRARGVFFDESQKRKLDDVGCQLAIARWPQFRRLNVTSHHIAYQRILIRHQSRIASRRPHHDVICRRRRRRQQQQR
jgi:hypothetical protein